MVTEILLQTGLLFYIRRHQVSRAEASGGVPVQAVQPSLHLQLLGRGGNGRQHVRTGFFLLQVHRWLPEYVARAACWPSRSF